MSKIENDSDTKLFRFNKKMFLKLVPDEEQDKSYAYGKVVTQIYIEEKADPGAEFKRLKDEKQVSDLKKTLQIDDLQNREEIEKRERQRKRDEKSKEITINENDVVRNLNNYSTILKDIDLSKLINYMMYLDEGIEINVEKLTNEDEYLKTIENSSLNEDKKKYLTKILKKNRSLKDNNLINKRRKFINDELSKITEWEDDNNIIKNTFIENYISAKNSLDKAAAEVEAAKKAKDATAAEVAAATQRTGPEANAQQEAEEKVKEAEEKVKEAEEKVKEAEEKVKKAVEAVAAADNKLKEYLKKTNKNSDLFKEKIKNVKQYLRDEDNLEDSELINAAELDNTGYEAIQSINTLNENVEEFNKNVGEFNKILGIDN